MTESKCGGYVSGPTNSLLDVGDLSVGHADCDSLKSGVTVILPDSPAIASVHVMGGAPGTRETDLLAPGTLVEAVDALVLSGGSAFGLDAAQGVVECLASKGAGFDVNGIRVPIVPAAILFDLANGGDKAAVASIYRTLGATAFETAGQDHRVGSIGAGCGAIAGAFKGGLGTASLVLPNGTTVAALVACNAIGQTTVGKDGAFWASPFEIGGEYGSRPMPYPIEPTELYKTKSGRRLGDNTTIAVVATNATLDKTGAYRMAMAAQDGLARAIVPSHTPFDGDLVFGLSTATHARANPDMQAALGAAAAICLSRAIARGVYSAKPARGDKVPTWSETFA